MTSGIGFEAVLDYLNHEPYMDGMDDRDMALLLGALLSRQSWYMSDAALDELSYRLDDTQRDQLRHVVEVISRRNDAALGAEISEPDYHIQKARRFGAQNPERMHVPFWVFMVRRGWPAWQARMQFDSEGRRYRAELHARYRPDGSEILDAPRPHYDYGPAVWCFSRFGMSRTKLPDGRLLCIAGEHEDFYDPDFCIYNDVIVIDQDLSITIYGYPSDLFPPIDFHSATLVGDSQVWLIGNLGYVEQRRPGETPVYLLNAETMQIQAVPTTGRPPGWISRHTAVYNAARHAIDVSGGQRLAGRRGRQTLSDMRSAYRLDLATLQWSRRGRTS